MKKRIFLLLAVLALLVGCLAMSSFAADPTVNHRCEACGKNVDWLPFNSTSLSSGTANHLYLSADYTGGQLELAGGSKTTLCLDLYGHSMKNTSGRMVYIGSGCTFNLQDSKGGGTVSGTTGGGNPGGGTVSVQGGSTFNMYGGTLQFNTVAHSRGTGKAGVVQVSGTMNMSGGLIKGADMVKSTYWPYDDADNGYGGAMIVWGGGHLNMSGGTITTGTVPYGGEAPCVYLNNTNSKVTLSGTANVQEIYCGNPATRVTFSGTYTGRARIRMNGTVANNTVIATATGADISGADIMCTNGDGYTVTKSGNDLVLGSFTPTATKHKCESCGDIVTWTPLENYRNSISTFKTAGHYHVYLSKSYAATDAFPQIVVGADAGGVDARLCLDMYGNSLATDGRAMIAFSGGRINLMDTKGNGSITGTTGNNNTGGGSLYIFNGARVSMYSGTLTFTRDNEGKTPTETGGVCRLEGAFYMYGGTVQGGEVVQNSTELNGYGGAFYMKGTGKLYAYGGAIKSGIVPARGEGPCIYVAEKNAFIELGGDADIEEIYYNYDSSSKLNVVGTYTGKTNIRYNPANVTVREGLTAGTCANGDVTNAELICVDNGSEYYIIKEGNNLVVTAFGPGTVAAAINSTGSVGYDTLAEAISNCTDGYVQVIRPSNEDVTITKDLYIDLNGQSLTGTILVKDGVTVYGKDSETDDYTVTDNVYGKMTDVVLEGTAKVTGMVAECEFAEDSYLLVNESDVLSFHRVKLQIYAMTLRADKAGLYYKSHFLGDEKVAANVSQYGVALSVVQAPAASNLGSTSKCTVFTGFKSGAGSNAGNASSTLLKGILKDTNTDDTNKRNIGMPVYGRGYIKTTSGEYVFGKTVQRSMTQQLQGVDAMVSTLSASQYEALETLYTKYQTVLKDCNLTNLVNAIQKQEEGTLKVLIVGNSHGLDTTNLLYEVFHKEAPEKKVVVGALYYSGCTVAQHRDFMSNNKPVYSYHKNDGTAANRAWVVQYDVPALTALQDEQWDVILMQQMNSYMAREEPYVASDWQYVIDYILNNQDARPKLGFHMVWANPDDYALYLSDTATYGHPNNRPGWRSTHETNWPVAGGTTYEMDVMYDSIISLTNKYLVDTTDFLGEKYFDFVIPSGTVVQYAQNVLGRTQPQMYRDYTHVSDYGRLMCAYLWYAQLMELDSISTVKVDSIPAVLRHQNSQYPTSATGYAIDADMKADIIAAVNWTLKHPFAIQ